MLEKHLINRNLVVSRYLSLELVRIESPSNLAINMGFLADLRSPSATCSMVWSGTPVISLAQILFQSGLVCSHFSNAGNKMANVVSACPAIQTLPITSPRNLNEQSHDIDRLSCNFSNALRICSANMLKYGSG